MKNKEKKKDGFVSLKKTEGFETNPFMIDLDGKMYLQPRANMVIAKGENIVNTQTGEVLKENVVLGRRKVVDKSQFAKIYATEIGVFHDLSKSAILVFMHLSKVMDYDNKAIFDYRTQHKKIGYKTEVSALNGIRELITKKIIAPHVVSGVWWMNPAIICKGERFAKYTEFLTEEQARKEEKARLSKQGKDFVENLPEKIGYKYKQATSVEPTDSLNGKLPLKDINPYKQTSILDKEQQNQENEREKE